MLLVAQEKTNEKKMVHYRRVRDEIRQFILNPARKLPADGDRQKPVLLFVYKSRTISRHLPWMNW